MTVKRYDVGMPQLAREKWHKIMLDRDGFVTCGGEDFHDILQGKRFVEILSEESRKRFNELLCGTVGNGDDDILFTSEGVPVEILIVSLDNGCTAYYREVGTRFDALERLAIFHRHFITTQVGICITDPEARIIEANGSFLKLYGYTLDEVIGKNPRILKSGRQSPHVYKEMWQRITDPSIQHWSGEIINRRKNAAEVTVHLTVSAVYNNSGILVGYVASTIDMTVRKQMERELVASNEELLELNQLKSDVMAITSHDLKSPLNAIISRARMLIEMGEQMPVARQKSNLAKMVEAGGKMTSFIDELLDLEKIESGRYQLNTARLHLDTVLNACVETNSPTARERGVQLILRYQGTSRPLRADFVKMEQVFNNIISNAVRFTPAGGSITIVYRDEPGAPKRITIADTGPGIPEKDLPLIFDRYFQARIKGGIATRVFGAGLGLSIVKKIVELHDGKVWAANSSMGGCTFNVEIPENRKALSGQDLAALILDPNQEIHAWLETPLRHKGVSCFMAKNLYEAKRITERERPELVFAADASLSAELRAHVASMNDAVRRIRVRTCNVPAHPDFYDQELVAPIIDIELFELLDDILINLDSAEAR